MGKANGSKVKKRNPGLPARKKINKEKLEQLYVKKNKSIRDIADLLNCSKDRIYRALKDYGIERRSHTWGPKLECYDLNFLRELINKKGYRKGAKELDVDKSTLYRYLKRMSKIG